MKEGWVYKKLGEIATIRRGLTYKKEDEVEKSNKIVLRSNNVDLETHQLIFDELKYLKDDFDIPEEKILKKGDLLMCMSNGSKIHLGKVALIEQNTHFAFGGFMSAIEHNKSVLDKFFYYALISPNFKQHIKELQDGANINNLKIRDIESFSIPVPPLSDQQRIVSYLDAEFAKIEAIKANAEKQLQAAKDLFQAALKELLTPKEGWVEKKLGEVCSKIGSGATPKGGKKVYLDNGCSLIRSLNVLYGSFKYSELAHITEEAAEQLKGVTIKENDVLFNITGASIARCCVVPTDVLPARVNQHVSILRVYADSINPLFLSFLLLSPKHQKELLTIGEAGTTRQALTKTDLENHIIEIPNIEMQSQIIKRISELSAKVKALQTNYTETITLCNDLKQALLKKVFEEDG